MFVRTWRLATVLFMALSMGVALAHLLEMPAKLGYEPALWLTLLQTLYPPAFGTAGAGFEVAAVISVVVLVFLVRKRRPAFRWTLIAALAIVAAHAAFWLLIAPVNAALLPLFAWRSAAEFRRAACAMGVHPRCARHPASGRARLGRVLHLG